MRQYDEHEDEEILDEDEYEDEDEETSSRKRSGLILPLAGGTFVTTEIVSLMMNGKWLGAGFGVLASAFIYLKGQDVLDATQGLFDWDVLAGRLPRSKGGRSLKDRLLGQYPDEEEQDIYDDEDEMEDLPRPGKQQRIDDELARPQRKRSGIFLFSGVLKDFTPSLDKIYLGTLASGEHVFCRAKHLCHVALAGPTRGGKSSLMRMLLAQLCYAGASVLILNPHYSRYIHADEGDYEDQDWTPFEPYLVFDPMECRKYEVITHYLKQVAEVLLPERLEKYAHSQPVGKPYFIALDELPAIVAHIKEAPDYLAYILREGAKVGIFLIVASHDFLVKTISPNGAGGAVRECYRTAFYAGGDATTAKILLDMPANQLPEADLGTGTIMLRNWQVCKKAALASAPLLDNRALYTLLGASTYKPEKQQSRGAELTVYRDDPITDPHGRAARPDALRLYAAGERLSTRRSEREKRLRNAAPVHTPLVARVPDPPVQDEVEISAQDAFAIWSAGNSNVRDLAKAMGITVYQATKLYGAMVDAGLIERKTKVVVKGSID